MRDEYSKSVTNVAIVFRQLFPNKPFKEQVHFDKRQKYCPTSGLAAREKTSKSTVRCRARCREKTSFGRQSRPTRERNRMNRHAGSPRPHYPAIAPDRAVKETAGHVRTAAGHGFTIIISTTFFPWSRPHRAGRVSYFSLFRTQQWPRGHWSSTVHIIL